MMGEIVKSGAGVEITQTLLHLDPQDKVQWPWTHLALPAQVWEELEPTTCITVPPLQPVIRCAALIAPPWVCLPSVYFPCPWLGPVLGQCQLSPRPFLPSFSLISTLKLAWCFKKVNLIMSLYYSEFFSGFPLGFGWITDSLTRLSRCHFILVYLSSFVIFPITLLPTIVPLNTTVCVPWSFSHSVPSTQNTPFLHLLLLTSS